MNITIERECFAKRRRYGKLLDVKIDEAKRVVMVTGCDRHRVRKIDVTGYRPVARRGSDRSPPPNAARSGF